MDRVRNGPRKTKNLTPTLQYHEKSNFLLIGRIKVQLEINYTSAEIYSDLYFLDYKLIKLIYFIFNY